MSLSLRPHYPLESSWCECSYPDILEAKQSLLFCGCFAVRSWQQWCDYGHRVRVGKWSTWWQPTRTVGASLHACLQSITWSYFWGIACGKQVGYHACVLPQTCVTGTAYYTSSWRPTDLLLQRKNYDWGERWAGHIARTGGNKCVPLQDFLFEFLTAPSVKIAVLYDVIPRRVFWNVGSGMVRLLNCVQVNSVCLIKHHAMGTCGTVALDGSEKTSSRRDRLTFRKLLLVPIWPPPESVLTL